MLADVVGVAGAAAVTAAFAALPGKSRDAGAPARAAGDVWGAPSCQDAFFAQKLVNLSPF